MPDISATSSPSVPTATTESRPRGNQPSFAFTVIARDPSGRGGEGIDAIADSLFEAGCDDATVAIQNNVVVIEFDREARNFLHAVAAAIRDVRKAGLQVLRVEPDVYVSAAEIARRCAVSREAVRKWFQVHGRTAPAPVIAASTASPLYDWPSVLRWLRRHHPPKVAPARIVEGRIVKRVNQALRHGRDISRDALLRGDRGGREP